MQITCEGWRKSLLALPWLLGLAVILSVVCIYIITSPKFSDSFFTVWAMLGIAAFSFGWIAGWTWGKWGFLFPLIVPAPFLWFAYLQANAYLSMGWNLPSIMYLIPTETFLMLGIILGNVRCGHSNPTVVPDK